VKESERALWWARIRASGPRKVAPSGAAVPGMARLVEPGAEAVWVVPVLPEGARPSVLAELGLPELMVEQPNDTARVLAACLRCCWTDPAGPLWPASSAPYARVASVFAQVNERDPAALHRALLAGVRRLAGAGWLLFDEAEQTVRLGPRVAGWESTDFSVLRELWRLMPAPAPGGGSG
jgi:hypothetical protein